MSTLPPRHPHRGPATSRTHPRTWRPLLRSSVVAAVTAGGLAGGALLLAAAPATATTPTPSDVCTTAQAALEAEFGELDLDEVTSAMVTGWIMRLEDTSPRIHAAERAMLTAQAEADSAREVLGGLIDEALAAEAAVAAARAELAAAEGADPVDPDRVATAEEELATAEESLVTAQRAEEEAEVVLQDADAALRGRQHAFEQAVAEMDALIAEVAATTGDGEGDWAGLRDRLAAVETACEDTGSTPEPSATPRPVVAPAPQAPVARPVTGTATFTG